MRLARSARPSSSRREDEDCDRNGKLCELSGRNRKDRRGQDPVDLVERDEARERDAGVETERGRYHIRPVERRSSERERQPPENSGQERKRDPPLRPESLGVEIVLERTGARDLRDECFKARQLPERRQQTCSRQPSQPHAPRPEGLQPISPETRAVAPQSDAAQQPEHGDRSAQNGRRGGLRDAFVPHIVDGDPGEGLERTVRLHRDGRSRSGLDPILPTSGRGQEDDALDLAEISPGIHRQLEAVGLLSRIDALRRAASEETVGRAA